MIHPEQIHWNIGVYDRGQNSPSGQHVPGDAIKAFTLLSHTRELGQQVDPPQTVVPVGQVAAIKAKPPPARTLSRFGRESWGISLAIFGSAAASEAAASAPKERKMAVVNFMIASENTLTQRYNC